MPNVTISVSDQLKASMDALSEVNWSEVCRSAISRYIAQRKNPIPNIELDLRNANLIDYHYVTGCPTLELSLKIHNRMDSEIMVDRILANATFFPRGETRGYPIGSAYYLHRRYVKANSSAGIQMYLSLPTAKIIEFKDKFKNTFNCRVRCVAYAEGFRNEYQQEVKVVIPIDQWKDLVKKALMIR